MKPSKIIALSFIITLNIFAKECTIMLAPSDFSWDEKYTVTANEHINHELNLYSTTRLFDDVITCEGVPIVKENRRGYYDTIDGHGFATTYSIYELANGDQIFATTHTSVARDCYGNSNADGSITITGGTGRYVGIRGYGTIKRNFNFSDKKLVPGHHVLTYALPEISS